jgi:O-methyltransferase
MVDSYLARHGMVAYAKKPNHHYVPDYYGKSAIKQIDVRAVEGFGQLASEVIEHRRSYHYYDRLYVLFQAVRHLKHLDAVKGRFNLAEVGVYKGGTSYFMAGTARVCGIENADLYAFDTFEGHASEDLTPGFDLEDVHTPGLFGDTDFEAVKDYLKEFPNVRITKGRIQDTCHLVEHNQFHCVHLDMDIYEPTRLSLDFFHERLVPGGVIVVDDYGYTTCPGVAKAVDEFLALRCGYFFLHLLSGQCVLTKVGT